MNCLTLCSVCIIMLCSYMKCGFWPNSPEISLGLGNESSQNRRADEHLNPPECEIIMASWCHFSGESSEQMAKIGELNLVYTTPLRTTKKLVWIGFKRISEQRGFSKFLSFQNRSIPVYTQDLWTLNLGADSGKRMDRPLLRPSGEIKMRKPSGNVCLYISSNSFPSVKMLNCYCYVH